MAARLSSASVPPGLASRLGLAPGAALAQATRATDGQLDSWLAIAADGSVTALHRQVRARPGHAHGADAADRRGAVACRSARVRLVQCDTPRSPRPGNDVGEPVASDQLQRTEPGAGRRDRARGARSQLAADASRRSCRSADDRRRRRRREKRRDEAGLRYGELVGGKKFNVALDRRPRGSLPASGKFSAPPCRASTCRRWPPASSSSSTTCACPAWCTVGWCVRPKSARRWSSVDEASVADVPGLDQGRRQEELRRRRRREAVAGDAGGGAAEGDVDRRRRTACAAARFYEHLRTPAVARHAHRRLAATSIEHARRRGNSGQGDVPTIRIRCMARWARRARSQTCRRQPRHDLVARRSRRSASGARAAKLLDLPVDAVRVVFARGSGCYGINGADTVSLRRRAAVAGGRPAGSRAALAQGRDGVGELRLRLRDRSARRPRRQRHHRRVGLRGVVAVARRPARLRHARATSITGMLAGFEPAPFAPRRRRRRPPDASTTAATPRRRM